ncbi:MAG TPA: hypothetical protein VF469_17910, partial [Kofleriaceae bacterium]
MAKYKSDGEASEAASKRRPQKKTAAPKPGAKGRSAKPSKPAKPAKPTKPSKAAKPARPARPARKPPEPPVQAELPIRDLEEVVEVYDEEAEIDLELPEEESREPETDEDEDEDEDEIEDAEIVAETTDTTVESEPAEEAPATLAGSDTEEVVEVGDQPPPLSPEEEELSAVYGDELSQPVIAHAEYTDRQTADEDRPMMPEINARDERKQQWQERRDRRRRRRDERDRLRHERRDHAQGRSPQEARPDRP